jgi:phosphate starvation-inducible membrane PsiE
MEAVLCTVGCQTASLVFTLWVSVALSLSLSDLLVFLLFLEFGSHSVARLPSNFWAPVILLAPLSELAGTIVMYHGIW